jgi:hypothetical protein
MEDRERREPRLLPPKATSWLPLHDDDHGSDLGAGDYIAQLANAWAAVRKKPIDRQ